VKQRSYSGVYQQLKINSAGIQVATFSAAISAKVDYF
jgi:hypothetical protein